MTVEPTAKPPVKINVPIASVSEPWGEVLLEDGTRIKMRIILTSVNRLEGEYEEDGAPKYEVATNVSINLHRPRELYKPAPDLNVVSMKGNQ